MVDGWLGKVSSMMRYYQCGTVQFFIRAATWTVSPHSQCTHWSELLPPIPPLHPVLQTFKKSGTYIYITKQLSIQQ